MSIEKNTPNFLRQEELFYTVLINDTIEVIQDAFALGLYVYLSSKPPQWIICKKQLMNHFSVGRDVINAKFKYLQDLGLLEVKSVRDEAGRITHWETLLKRKSAPGLHKTSDPGGIENTGSTILKNQNLVFPESGKSAPIKNRSNINNKIENLSLCKQGEYRETYFPQKKSQSTELSIEQIESHNPHQIPHQYILDYLTTRQKKRAPLTPTGWNRLTNELSKLKAKGQDPIEIFEKMVAHGWLSINANWSSGGAPKDAYFVEDSSVSTWRNTRKGLI